MVYEVTSVTEVTKYLIAFSTVPGIGAVRLKLLVDYFGSPKAAWEAEEKTLAKVGLPKDVLPQFLGQRQKLNIDQYLEEVARRGIKFATIFDKDYPDRLRHIPDPPNILYVRSNLTTEQFSNLTIAKIIAVVGTRKVTSYGQEVTEKLTAGLSAAGVTIVSGMALGVDGIAHGAVLNAGGKTIAVLGAGVDVIYPRQHKELYYNILDHDGAIVSEVAPEKTVIRGIFPARNRIISGLSEAVLVTEGAIDSGSLITARAALEQGREVFAVPGPINSQMAEGTNYLLKQGAKLVTGVDDILEELGYETRGTHETYKTHLKAKPKGDSEEEQKIIDLLAAESLDFDELARRTKIPLGKLGTTLSLMEVKNKLKNIGRSFSLS